MKETHQMNGWGKKTRNVVFWAPTGLQFLDRLAIVYRFQEWGVQTCSGIYACHHGIEKKQARNKPGTRSYSFYSG